MSKMSQLHAELSEQAAELGFESLGEAEQAGYGVDWKNHKLLPPEEAAHEALMQEKQEIFRLLLELEIALLDHRKRGSDIDKFVRIAEFIEREVK